MRFLERILRGIHGEIPLAWISTARNPPNARVA
jgi:hypothetical protein